MTPRIARGSGTQRHINGVVSNGVVPKNQICKLVAKPAPDIFRIQGVYHNEGFWRDKAALLIRPGLIRPGLRSPKVLPALQPVGHGRPPGGRQAQDPAMLCYVVLLCCVVLCCVVLCCVALRCVVLCCVVLCSIV